MKILVIGTIDTTHSEVSGQYDRTEIIVEGLRNVGQNVEFANMMNWIKNPFKVFYRIINGYFHNDVIIFLASLRGVKVLLYLLTCLRKVQNKPVIQIVIGGMSNCLFIKKNKRCHKFIQQLDAIFVEVEHMVKEYTELQIHNVTYLPNCKKIRRPKTTVEPTMNGLYKFCTYSRVTPSKGIKEAIDAIVRLNQEFQQDVCSLDIYGTYLPEDQKWFEDILACAPSTICYKGRINRIDSLDTLSKYDMMLFPTKHMGEGVPGAMIDCYEAGLPIIVCDTSFMKYIVKDGITGYVYDGSRDTNLDLAIKRYVAISKDEMLQLRQNCREEVEKYDTENVIKTIMKYISSLGI